MSKRLKEIGETIDEIFELRDNDDSYQFEKMESFWKYDVPYLYEQAERVEELIKLVNYHQQKQKEAEDENEPFRHQNKRYLEVLSFYADKSMYVRYLSVLDGLTSDIDYDNGEKARTILEEYK